MVVSNYYSSSVVVSNYYCIKRLTPRQTREMLKGMRNAADPVIVTSHVQGSDLIVRTLEYLGDRAKPSVPKWPFPADPDPKRF